MRIQASARRRWQMAEGPLNRINRLVEEYQIAPAAVTVATDKPFDMGEVVVFAGFRFAVSEILTEAEFHRRRSENRERRIQEERERGFQFGDAPGAGSFTAGMHGSIPEPGSDQMADQPTANLCYFYALRRLPGRSGK